MDIPNTSATSILIAKQNQLLGDCLKELFILSGYTVVGQTTLGTRVLQMAKLYKPSICILGAMFDDVSVEKVCDQLRQVVPRTRIILYAHSFDDMYISTSQHRFGDGFITSDCSYEELLLCLDVVAKGKTYVTPKLNNWLHKSFHNELMEEEPDFKLSDREKEVLKLVADGLTMPKIGQHLYISRATVNNHCYNIRKKLNLSGRNALHQYAFTMKNSRIIS